MKTDSYAKWKSQVSWLADGDLESGREKEAQSLLRKVLRVRPEEIGCRVKLAQTAWALKDPGVFREEGLALSLLPSPAVSPQQRLEILRRLLSVYPEDLNIKLKTAQASWAAGESEPAEALHLEAAEFYLARGLPLKAIGIYEKILEAYPDRADLLRKTAQIYAGEGVLDQAIRKFFDLGQSRLDRGSLQEASAAFEEILSIDPVNENACLLAAKAYILQNEIPGAVKAVQKQIMNHLDKGRRDAALSLSEGLAALLLENNRPDEAAVQRERMAKLLFESGEKEQAAALLDKVAETALASGDWAKFVEILDRELKFFKEQNNTAKIAETYRRMIPPLFSSDKEKARQLLEDLVRELSAREQIAALDQALQSIAKELEAARDLEESRKVLSRLGDVYAGFYRTNEAVRIFESLVHGGGTDPFPYLRLADLYVQESNFPRAADLYCQAMDLCVRTRDPARAEEIFNKASEKIPGSAALLSQMGMVHYTLGKWDLALQFYKRAAAVDPVCRPAALGMAMTYAKKGMLDEMAALAKRLVAKGLIAEILEEYRKALGVSQTPAQCSMAMGILYKDLGFMEEAILEFQSASGDPKLFLAACNQLGLCFKAQGFGHLAVRQFQKALEKGEEGGEEALEIRYNLAVAYQEAGMIQEAANLYNDILVLDIGYKDVKARLRKLKSAKTEGKIISLPRGTEGGKHE